MKRETNLKTLKLQQSINKRKLKEFITVWKSRYDDNKSIQLENLANQRKNDDILLRKAITKWKRYSNNRLQKRIFLEKKMMRINYEMERGTYKVAKFFQYNFIVRLTLVWTAWVKQHKEIVYKRQLKTMADKFAYSNLVKPKFGGWIRLHRHKLWEKVVSDLDPYLYLFIDRNPLRCP